MMSINDESVKLLNKIFASAELAFPTTHDWDEQKMGDDALIPKIQALARAKRIKQLYIQNNNLTDAIMPIIISDLILNEHVHLEILDLKRNSITDTGAAQLLEALKTRNTLSTLSLQGNPMIDPELIQSIQALMPQKPFKPPF
jgi:Leucine-rich repeat (LRR) protein